MNDSHMIVPNLNFALKPIVAPEGLQGAGSSSLHFVMTTMAWSSL